MLLISWGKLAREERKVQEEKQRNKRKTGNSVAVGKKLWKGRQKGWKDQEKGKQNKVRGGGTEGKKRGNHLASPPIIRSHLTLSKNEPSRMRNKGKMRKKR